MAELVRPGDVKDGLKAFKGCNGIFDSLFSLKKVAMRLLELALEDLEDRETLESLIDVLVPEMRAFRLEGWSNLGVFGKVLQADSKKRRIIIRAFLERLTEKAEGVTWQIASLCLPDDVPWLLDCAASSSSTDRQSFFKVVRPLLNPDFIRPCWDEIISRLRTLKALEPMREYFDPWPLKGAKARTARAEKKKNDAIRDRRQKEMEGRRLPNRNERIKTVLTKFRPEQVWIELRAALFITDTREWVSGFEFSDIEHSPGWTAADEPEREKIRGFARRFLLNRDKEFLCEPNRTTPGADASFAAAWLLRNELEVPGPLQDAFAARCVLAVVWHFDADNAQTVLTALIYRLNPQRCREAYLQKLEFDAARDTGLTLASRPFLNCWDLELSKITERFLRAKARRPETISSVLAELARVDLSAIPRIWRKLALRAVKRGKVGLQRAAAASELMIELFAEECWDELFPFLDANREVTRITILRSSPVGHGYGLKPTRELSEEHLSALYLLVYSIFSPSDPEEQWDDTGEPRSVTSRYDAGRFRDSLVNQLVARGNPAACCEMRRVANSVAKDQHLWMKKRWLDCVELVRRKAWNPIAIAHLLEIARRRNAYWIDNEDDLLLVALESLDELQRSIRNSPSGDVLDFWDYKRRGGRLSDHRPKAEIDVARKVYAWLHERLGTKHGAIIHREVTIQWDQRRTDIEVVVAAHPQKRRPELAVVLEVKLAWNAGIRLDAKRQLRDRYLKRTGRRRGIYVVAWFECDVWRQKKRPLRAGSFAAAKQVVAAICSQASKPPIIIAPYVLDCSLPT